jgi:hypothetical protein
LAFTTVAVGGAAIIALVRRVRGPRTTHDGIQQATRPRSVVISRVAAVLLVGLVASIANVNSFPNAPERSFAAWVLIALLALLPLVGGFFLLLQYIRQRIGPTEFDRMVSTARVVRPVLPPGPTALKIAFVMTLIVIVVVSTIAFRFGMDHVVF